MLLYECYNYYLISVCILATQYTREAMRTVYRYLLWLIRSRDINCDEIRFNHKSNTHPLV